MTLFLVIRLWQTSAILTSLTIYTVASRADVIDIDCQHDNVDIFYHKYTSHTNENKNANKKQNLTTV